jgi:gamma-glutamylcyclotransferase (GGCT)/AIG2-like uncharacterized protein YtfP
MTHHVFTYGSLMFDEVWGRVVAGRYASVAATLAGHARYQVRDETYPGMVVVAEAAVDGVLHLDVDEGDLERLDHFEGDDYIRRVVTVVDAQGSPLAAQTYLYRHGDRLLATSWEPQAFAMQRFIETYCRDKLGPDAGR